MRTAPSADELLWGSLFRPRLVRATTLDTERLRGLDVERTVELSYRPPAGRDPHLFCILRPVKGR